LEEEMFKNVKKEYLILLIIIVVLTAYLLKNDRNKTETALPELKQIDKTTIKKIIVKGPKGQFTIVVNKKKWSLLPETYPVIDGKVNKMVELLANADISDLMSKAGKYDRYGLGKKTGTSVIAKDDKKDLRNIIIGHNSESGNRTFVKLKDDDNIYQARGDYKGSFNISKQDIINKNIFTFNSSDIVELLIEIDGKQEHFVKVNKTNEVNESKVNKKDKDKKAITDSKTDKEMIWVNKTDNKNVNGKAIDEYISKNSNIRCDSYIGKKSNNDISYMKLVFVDKTKKKYELNISKKLSDKGEGRVEMFSSASDFKFYMTKDNIKKLKVDIDKLKSIKKIVKGKK
jgi:hypothetical protein